MANIRVRGADGLTYVYLWAEGEGTEDNPYKSKYLVAQEGDWDVSVNNLPEVYPVSFSWLGLTNTELREAPLEVTGAFYPAVQPVSITEGVIALPSGAASEITLSLIEGKLPDGLTIIEDRLKVDANVSLPNSYPVTGTVSVSNLPDGLTVENERLKVDANVSLPDIYPVSGTVSVDNFPTSQPVTGDFYPEIQAVDTGLNQPLTLAELQGITINVSEQTPVDVSSLATEETLSNIETVLTNPIQVTPTVFPDFNIPNHNRRELSYTGNNLTSVVYKSNGVTVATLTLGYTGDVLTSVERS